MKAEIIGAALGLVGKEEFWHGQGLVWAFTNARPGPGEGITFYMEVGASPEEVAERWGQKLAAELQAMQITRIDKSMSAKKYPEIEPHRCVCGEMPAISVLQAGQVRLYKVACRCGLNSLHSDDQAEAVGFWNDVLGSRELQTIQQNEAA